jgi:hypothetical protein
MSHTHHRDIFSQSPALNYMLKTLYVMAIFLLGMWFMFNYLPLLKENISLRGLPYPYKAGLAISNDIEGISSIQEFLAIQKYLCSSENTPWGKGLNLEVGNSFSFYDFVHNSSFTIFDTLGIVREDAAKVIIDFNRAGYIEGLSGSGLCSSERFNQIVIDKIVEFCRKNELSVPIWYTESEDSSLHSSHSYLIKEMVVRYIDTGEPTFIIGQDAPLNPKIMFTKGYEWLTSIFFTSKENKKTFNWNNALLNLYTFDDNCQLWRFKRFLNHRGELLKSPMEAKYLAEQITVANLEKLIQSGGYMLLHTRLGYNTDDSEWVPLEARMALQELSAFFNSGQILVATTSRLLDYNLIVKHLDWKWSKEGDYYNIEIIGLKSSASPSPELSSALLSGLTFYTPHPSKTRVFYQGEAIPLIINPPDKSKRWSVTLPWKRLSFPLGYR